MKAVGAVRKIDHLGRVILPKNLRSAMDLPIETPMELFVDGEFIMMRKYQPACILCDSTYNVELVEGKRICGDCLQKITSIWSASLEGKNKRNAI